MNIEELIERLEKATGYDRELDEAVSALLFPEHEFMQLVDAPEGTGCMMYRWPSGQYSSALRATTSIDAAVKLCELSLPGWGWRVATCCVSDDAWVFPDFNNPEHGERLKREFNQEWDWSELTDVDLRPPGRHAIALILSILRAKQIIEEAA